VTRPLRVLSCPPVLAIVLAAGTGRRLGARCDSTPKPCIHVAGRPLLSYVIANARAAGAGSIVVVAGHIADKTEAVARQLGADDVLVNRRHAVAGNLESFEVARRAGHVTGDTLILNSDHIYHPAIGGIVATASRTATQVVAFIDRDRVLRGDDMKVRLDDEDHVLSIDKQLDSWDAGYVGMTFIPVARLPAYLEHVDNVHRERGDRAHVEAVLARMASVDPAVTVDVSGHGWLEVDDEADLARAEAALAEGSWYPPPRP
jgi:choline kinase